MRRARFIGSTILLLGCGDDGAHGDPASTSEALASSSTAEPPDVETSAGGDAEDADADTTTCGGTTGCTEEPEEPDPAGEYPVVPGQLEKVCARGAHDPVAQSLCAVDPASIDSLPALLGTLGLSEDTRGIAANINSSSLASRLTSALNPRVLVFPKVTDSTWFVAYAYARGEQLVELAAWDPSERILNFYAMPFVRGCDETGCDLADLVTERVERDWEAWTLYQDVDLVNKTVDCLVCHQPLGPDSPRILRFQEINAPWLHWFPGGTADEVIPERDVARDRFLAAHEGEASYAGIPLPEYSKPLSEIAGFESGAEGLSRFVDDYQVAILGIESAPAPFHHAGMQPSEFDSNLILDDATNGHRDRWDGYFADVLAGTRIPIPSDAFDPSDPAERDAAAISLAGFTAGAVSVEQLIDPRDIFGVETRWDLSVEPLPDEPVEQLFTHFCRRCHNSQLDQTLTRAKFDVDELGELDAAEREAVILRLTQPKDSQWLMPPRRTADLPDWAIDAMVEHVSR